MDKLSDHSDRDHAKYAPSAAHRWLVCHGSIAASEGIQEKSSSYAEEGTECHEAAADILNGVSWNKATKDLSDDQTWIVEEYTNYVFDLIDSAMNRDPRARVLIEQRGRAPEISPDFHGTADVAIIANRQLRIIDLKAGHGPVATRLPDGTANPQLLSYAVLTLAELGCDMIFFNPKAIGIDSLKITIVQPRVYDQPQTIRVGFDELQEFIDSVSDAIGQIEAGDVGRVAGDHCKYCPARGRCPTLRNEAVKRAKITFDDAYTPVRNYSPDELASILNEAETIAAHVQGVREHARREMEKGRVIPGWKLVPKRAVSRWTDEGWEKVRRQFEGFTFDTFMAMKPKTPNQILKALKANGIDYDISGHFTKESSGPTLAPVDDPREAVKADPFGDDK